MKSFILTSVLLLSSFVSFSQKYFTQNATISFLSETPIENIEATNNQVSTVINSENGEVVFTMLMKAFAFEKALMQEHFNEKYVESDEFPKATFKGTIADFKKVLNTSEKLVLTATGELTMHGKTKMVAIPVTMSFENNILIGTCSFVINPEEFDIKIPGAVRKNIAKEITITVNATYGQL